MLSGDRGLEGAKFCKWCGVSGRSRSCCASVRREDASVVGVLGDCLGIAEVAGGAGVGLVWRVFGIEVDGGGAGEVGERMADRDCRCCGCPGTRAEALTCGAPGEEAEVVGSVEGAGW